MQAYDHWAATYDYQAGNVVFALESSIFTDMLAGVSIEGKIVLDIGCGTGRHWPEILACGPREIIGIDSSSRMLEQLKSRQPGARTLCAAGDRLTDIDDASCDVIVSTLTLAHIPNSPRVIHEWYRKLRSGGAMLITDFHPEAIRAGMKRTFVANGKTIEIEHHVTELRVLCEIAAMTGLTVVSQTERTINESVRPLFERANYLDAYLKNQGLPLVFGLHFLKPS